MNRYKRIPKDVLVERAKELECLYLIDEALTLSSLKESLPKISNIIPNGFRNILACTVVIEFDGQVYCSKPITEEVDELGSAIIVNGDTRGYIKVMYPKNTFPEHEIVFLDQELRLLNTISRRISEVVSKEKTSSAVNYRSSWEAILELLQKTDHEILLYVCEKMISLLAGTNPNLVKNVFKEMDWVKYDAQREINYPLETLPAVDVIRLSRILFFSAADTMEDEKIYEYISLWVYQGKTYELIKVVDKKESDIRKIQSALSQYLKAIRGNEMYSVATDRWLKSELTRRFLTDNPKVIAQVQKHISIDAFEKLLDTFICSPRSIGKIGGKGTGLFLANQIIEAHKSEYPELSNVIVPKTWYISSDELGNLIEDNGLDELNEHKYLDMLDIRTSYPRIIHLLKNARLSTYVLNELNQILDVCEDKPLIIRSSSLLEDQVDSSFSGKYKSLFITNTGTRAERKQQLVEGILEVYASIFSADSIQYRKERNLIDCSEQMGILIQEVVGSRVGPYYFPLYAGVAFSNNELRWSPRIRREDGLLRMVAGLGTRSVDRVGDDFPILLSPGQPNLRVNQSIQELQKYSPQYMDVLDVENNKFIVLPIDRFMREYGNKLPNVQLVASALKNDFITETNKYATDFSAERIIITFDALISNTVFIKQIQSILRILKDNLGYPVDIEFAGDGENFYLLQCRPQSRNHDNTPAAIPTDIPYQNVVFTGNRYISNGRVTKIRTVVYVDPAEYGRLEKHEDLQNVAAAVSRLNVILPRRSFILMGPGRWGSRGDIKLGVQVSYSDINNTAMLIELAVKESKYQPELSFGTHFFQDLVEENIKYLPLYPEDRDIVFNKAFFRSSKNALGEVLPQYAYLEDVIKVIKIEDNYFGRELIVLMNADLEKAVAYLEDPVKLQAGQPEELAASEGHLPVKEDQGWKWRHFMAEQIAAHLDMDDYGVKGIYLFGSTNNCTARLNSDIDILIHMEGTDEQRRKLKAWLNGWSLALSEINFLRTGYRSEGLLDVHYITDQDIKERTSYAVKIDSVFDPAYPLRIK